MKPYKLLPIEPGTTIAQWLEQWLEEVAVDIQSIIRTDNFPALRERNEKFTSYMATLTIIVSQLSQDLDDAKKLYGMQFPRPDKGITLYNEQMDIELSELRHTLVMVQALHDDVGRRLSGSQTNIRSATDVLKHGA